MQAKRRRLLPAVDSTVVAGAPTAGARVDDACTFLFVFASANEMQGLWRVFTFTAGFLFIVVSDCDAHCKVACNNDSILVDGSSAANPVMFSLVKFLLLLVLVSARYCKQHVKMVNNMQQTLM